MPYENPTCIYTYHDSSHLPRQTLQFAHGTQKAFTLFIYFTCSNCIASLVDCHLSCHVHKDLGLWTSLDMRCRNHSCGYCAGVHCHTIPLDLLRCSTSSGRADHSDHSSRLASSRHGNFCL